MNHNSLIGRTRKSINHDDFEKKRDERKEKYHDKFLENVPKGIQFSRLIYPPNNSEIILVGL